MYARFADDGLTQVAQYGARRDSAIWTGAYLAAESLRYMTTGAPDAAQQMAATLQTLHRWWTISGDPGYLARYAAPADSPPEILALLPADDDEVQRDVPFEGGLWHWRGSVSRDQYQGVLLGYALAYEASGDPNLRELIRADLVGFVEQLMSSERRDVEIRIGRIDFSTRATLQHVVYTDDETADGDPVIEIDPDNLEVSSRGMVVFWPNPSEILRDIPGLGWLPDLELPTQAIQLASAFAVALRVTEGVPDYAQRRDTIAAHYNAHVGDWLDIAVDWENTNDCGDAYFGLNIGFLPLYNWARLEPDPVRRGRIRREVLRDALWAEVSDHKNVLFAFIYASQAPGEDVLDPVVDAAAYQLALFPSAPNLAAPRDFRGVYPEDPNCPGLAATALDVDERVPTSFLWERQPWKLYDAGTPRLAFPGVDYLLAYWLGRYHGLIADDAPNTCLLWRPPADLLDADGDGAVQVSTDARLILRYLFGFRDATLVADATGASCTRCDGASIVDWIERALPYLDLDANGRVDALTDGLMLGRCLQGYTGDLLTAGALSPECSRCTAADIRAHCEMLQP